MKATMITLAAIFTLISNVLFAGNDYLNTTPLTVNSTYTLNTFAPVLPAEATFEEAAVAADYSGLFPAVPAEASFEDANPEISVNSLAPAVPSEADFE